jgi:hypothetical protein
MGSAGRLTRAETIRFRALIPPHARRWARCLRNRSAVFESLRDETWPSRPRVDPDRLRETLLAPRLLSATQVRNSLRSLPSRGTGPAEEPRAARTDVPAARSVDRTPSTEAAQQAPRSRSREAGVVELVRQIRARRKAGRSGIHVVRRIVSGRAEVRALPRVLGLRLGRSHAIAPRRERAASPRVRERERFARARSKWGARILRARRRSIRTCGATDVWVRVPRRARGNASAEERLADGDAPGRRTPRRAAPVLGGRVGNARCRRSSAADRHGDERQDEGVGTLQGPATRREHATQTLDWIGAEAWTNGASSVAT